MRLAPALGAVFILAGASCATPRSLERGELVARAQLGYEPPATAPGLLAIDFALGQVGKRYCWGGTGPSCFDCSGLAQAAWARAGVRLPRTADDMARALPEVAPQEVRAGDILWWPGHVGLYVGNGWVVEALDARHGVVMRPAATPHRALRPQA